MSCPHGTPIGGCDTCDEVDAAFEAGKRSAPQQEPVCWVCNGTGVELDDANTKTPCPNCAEQPAQRKPLTEEEILDANWVGNKAHITACPAPTAKGLIAFARAIEAAHGITAATQLKENT